MSGMTGNRAPCLLLAASLAVAAGVPPAPAAEGAKAFACVTAQYVMTAELATPRSFVLNFINLSDFVIVVQPHEFIYRGASGRLYIGQVFEQPHQDPRGEPLKYSASVLLRGHSFTGLTIVGAFRETDEIKELSIRIGAKRFYFQALERVEFERLAARVGELDLESQNPRAAITEAGLTEMGKVATTDGTSDWDRDWEGLLRSDGLNLPKIIERPAIEPTEEAVRTRTYGRVRLSALINRNGGIQDLKVEKGLGRGLDQRVLEAVRNSWIFLPATRNGEVVEGTVFLEVEFPPPAAKKAPEK